MGGYFMEWSDPPTVFTIPRSQAPKIPQKWYFATLHKHYHHHYDDNRRNTEYNPCLDLRLTASRSPPPMGFVTQPEADPQAISWRWFTASAYAYSSRLFPTTY